jgi:DNA-binding CsgD family transcriptional regulator
VRARALLEDIVGDPTAVAHHAEALRLLAEISYNADNYVEARRLFEQALKVTDNTAHAATIELGLSYVHANLSDFGVSRQFAYRALDRAGAIGDDPLLAEALATCAMTDFLCGYNVNWSNVERALNLEDRTRLVPLHHRPSTIAATLTLYVGRLAEARKQLVALHTWARERGDESDLAWLGTTLSWLETMAGDFDAALRLADESELVSRLTGSESGQAWALSQRAFVAAHTGDAAQVRSDCGRALELMERTAYAIPRLWVTAALGLLELSCGNPQAAWQTCAAAMELVEQHGIGEPVTFFFVPVGIEALIGIGQFDRAEAVLDLFVRRGRELDRGWALATAFRCRALLLAARGDATAALGAVSQALEQHARLDMPFELARTLLVEGQIRRRGREKRLARAALERAREMFDDMHAGAWGDRARAELARVGMRTAPTELTPTERRVAELAASGMSARAIAAILFVSPKTVQANLARAYQKLGLRSRAELGARMATNVGK